MLILKTVSAEMRAHNGFVWPKSGRVTAPDWNDRPECGGGLHGLPMGVGDGELLDWSESAVWIVADTGDAPTVDLGGKIKVAWRDVIYAGNREGAIALLVKRGADAAAMVCGASSATGYGGASSATGYRGASSATGDGGIAVSFYRCRASTVAAIVCGWHDGRRQRWTVGYPGEDGIEPGVWYVANNTGALIRSDDQSETTAEIKCSELLAAEKSET